MGAPTGKAAPALSPLQLGIVGRIDFKVQTWEVEGRLSCLGPGPTRI